jgi:hypothetical protein
MNLLDIPHFGHSTNVGICVKKLVARVHGGIIWIDRPVQINMELITNITRFPTIDMQPEYFLEKKMRQKELAEEVMEHFGTTEGNRGIIIKDINDNTTRLSSF